MTNGSNPLEGVTLANGRYLLTAKLGEGGMGSVYHARDQNIDADVVIKVPRRAMLEDPQFAGRFKEEIRSLVALSHPRIVKVSDVGDWDGLPFAVMQFLPGGSLEDARQSGADGTPVLTDPKDVLGWLPGIADALDYVHAKGFVHRDVKPGNILFDDQGHSFLSDFGVAKALASTDDANSTKAAMTGAGMVLGTPEYMAPELIMNEPFDGRIDQYALAVTVYETICGRRPFEDASSTKVLVLHTTKPVPPPSEVRAGLSNRLSQAVLKGMAKAPNDRYPNCAMFAASVVTAIGAGMAADERVRVKCPACGRALSMNSTLFAEATRTGRRVTCPGCKNPFDVSAAGGGETMSNPTSETPTRRATVILSPFGGLDGGSESGLSVPPARPNRVVGTQVIAAPTRPTEPVKRVAATQVVPGLPQPLEPPRRAAATMVLKSPAEQDGQFPNPLTADTEASPTEQARPVADAKGPSVPMMALAGGSVLSACVLGFVLMRSGSTEPPSQVVATRPAPSRVVATTPKTPTRLDDAKAALPAKSSPLEAPPIELTVPTASSKETVEAPGASGDPSEKPPVLQASVGEMSTALKPTLKSEMPKESPPGSIGQTPSRPYSQPLRAPDENVLANGPRTKVSLDEVVASLSHYSNQIIETTNLYCLNPTRRTNSDGSVDVSVTQSECELLPGKPVEFDYNVVSKGKSFDLFVDPKLAERIDARPRPGGGGDPAVLTLQILSRSKESNDVVCLIVKVDYFVGFSPSRQAGFKDRLIVKYKTLSLTPDGETQRFGLTDDWNKPARLGIITQRMKNRYAAGARLRAQVKQSSIDAVYNSILADGVRRASQQNAIEQLQQKRIQGVRP